MMQCIQVTNASSHVRAHAGSLTAFALPFSWVVVMASTLWEPLQQAGGSACLHDPQYEAWLPEPKGASAFISICSRNDLSVTYLSSFLYIYCSFFF